jgi:hypothetical protein
MRQARQSLEKEGPEGALSASPHRTQAGAVWTENSVQQTGQIGAEESCGRGEPQRAQGDVRRAQLKLSMGLRSTRTTARHRVVSDGGTSVVRKPVSLWKTHLARKRGIRMPPVGASIAHSGILGSEVPPNPATAQNLSRLAQAASELRENQRDAKNSSDPGANSEAGNELNKAPLCRAPKVRYPLWVF